MRAEEAVKGKTEVQVGLATCLLPGYLSSAENLSSSSHLSLKSSQEGCIQMGRHNWFPFQSEDLLLPVVLQTCLGISSQKGLISTFICPLSNGP